jgi:competence protein ComEC
MVMPAVALFVPDSPRGLRDTWLQWLWRLCRDSATVTIAATVMVLPLQLHYFGQFNLLSPVANMVAAPLSGVVLGGALAVVLVAPVLPALASVLGGATAAAMKCIHGASVVVAAQDWAIVRSGELPLPAVMLYYLVILSGYYVVRRDTPEFAAKSRARLALHVTAGVLVLFAATAIAHHRQGIRIWFLDVGQGDATFVEFPGGETLLVDAGDIRPDAGRAVVRPHLRGLGLRSA